MFFSQPLSTRFGTDLIANITSGDWDRLDIAVAWVRASGMTHLDAPLRSFLRGSGTLRIVVGIDLDNTSYEGLDSLLALTTDGKVDLFVHHNESGSALFHPKLYLFRRSTTKTAKLIVGSNNITEAGLYRNTEAGLEISSNQADPVIVSAVGALDSWCDTALGLAKPLTPALLVDLETNGYVSRESALKAAAASRASASRGPATKKLFGSVHVTAPAKPSTGTPTAKKAAAAKAAAKKAAKAAPSAQPVAQPSGPSAPSGQVLLMRVRKAHATDRPTQTQIPKDVAGSPFFSGITSVSSVHDGHIHTVRPAVARGIVNTLKLELPEIRHMNDPVVRFEHTPAGVVQYEAYDSSSPKGGSIRASLNRGLHTNPQSTFLTKPSTPAISTWWRFI